MSDDLAGLRLAILAPIAWPVPPRGYGPWEQIAHTIALGMRARGCDVTLFASGNSTTPVAIASVVPVGINEDPALNGDVYGALHTAHCFARANEFDLIHNNFDWKPLTYALATHAPPLVTTIHGFSSPPILAAYYAAAGRSFYCSISDADRDPGLDYLATTYNGIDPAEFAFVERPGDYLLFLGRFHPEKGTHLAIEIAKRAGVRLVIAAIPQDAEYFRTQVEPHVDGDRVRYVGAVERAERERLLGGALALVHMTTRPERFGLTMIEAMACGTPVLGAKMGSVPEIVVDGETGFCCASVDDAVARVPDLAALDRRACRRRVETAFTHERMVDAYAAAYRRALALRLPPPAAAATRAARAHDYWDRPMAFTDDPPKPRTLVAGPGIAWPPVPTGTAAIAIANLGAGDWRRWRALRLEALRESPAAFDSKLADWQGLGDREERWRERLASVPFNAVAELDGTPAGIASATTVDADGTTELISLWVAPAARGRGVGDALIAAVVGWARTRRAARVALDVIAANDRALALYHRNGFAIVASHDVSGQGRHEMQRPLEQTTPRRSSQRALL